jgi:hypothetical protein
MGEPQDSVPFLDIIIQIDPYDFDSLIDRFVNQITMKNTKTISILSILSDNNEKH